MINNLVHFPAKCADMSKSRLNIFPNKPSVIELNNAYLDPFMPLIINSSKDAFEAAHCLAEAIYIYKNKQTDWINRIPHRHQHLCYNASFNHEIEIRTKEINDYALSLPISGAKIYDDDRIYINLLRYSEINSFGHFLQEVLIKLKYIPASYLDKRLCYLFRPLINITDFKKWIKILSPTQNYDILTVNKEDKNILYFPKILDIKRPAPSAYFSKIEDYNYIRHNFQKHMGTKDAHCNNKIFFSRIAPYYRVVKNHNDLVKELEKIGVIFLYGNESLEFIYETINSASHICGYEGSMFTTASLFCNPETSVLQYTPETRKLTSISQCCFASPYYFIKFIPTQPNWDVELPIDEILEFYSTDKNTLKSYVQ